MKCMKCEKCNLKVFVLPVLILFMQTSIFAASAVAEKKVENKESWKENIELNGLKKGKYNVYVTAEDQSGNKTIEGPHNIYVDPDSDLPIADISNPRENMHVPGNLNIVGTCVDDDAVKAVQIIIDPTGNPDIDSENAITVEGTDYWSYFLDTSKMEEGEHSIEVYGIDVNDVVGNHKIIKWHLDRRQPKVTISEEHTMGERVSGTLKLSGTVTDGNGISRLMYSLDKGENYKDIKFKSNKNATLCEFNLSIDTTKLLDGGTICYFKTSDKQGTVGFSSFLFFVDNTKPDVKVVYPSADDVVNGIFTASGYAKDAMGIQKLSWEFAGKKADFELTAGNPYWSVELDSRTISGKSAPLVITAVDGVGNITTTKHTILLDQAQDKANVAIEFPTENATLKFGKDCDLFLRGIATDDDGVAKVSYILDSNPAVENDTDGVFCIDLVKDLENPLSVGNHTVKVWATDVTGVVGNAQVVKFSVMGDLPVFENRVVNAGKGKNDESYVNGMQLNVQNNPVYKGDVSSGNGIKSVSYIFDGKDEVVLASNINKTKFSFQIPIKDCTYGYSQLKILATDVFDRVCEDVVYFYVDDLTVSRAEKLYKPEVIFTDNKVNETGIIDVSAEKIISGYFVGGKASQVRFEPATNFANVSLSGNSIILSKGSAQGLSDPVSIVVRSHRGIEYRTKPFVLRSTVTSPKINFVGAGASSSASSSSGAERGANPLVIDGFSDVVIKGNVICAVSSNAKNNLTVKNLKYRILSGKTKSEWVDVTGNIGSGNAFSVEIPSSYFAEAVSVVEFEITDSLDQKTSDAVFVNKVRPFQEGEKKSSPVLSFIEGENYYYVASYKGDLEFIALKIAGEENASYSNALCGIVYKDNLKFGSTPLEISVKDEAGKVYTTSCTAKRLSTIKSYIDKVDEKKYVSGMEVSENSTISVVVNCPLPLASVKYNFSNQGEKIIAAKSIEASGENLYTVQIPVSSSEYKMHDIYITSVASDGSTCEISGSLSFVQSYPNELVKNAEKTYWALPSSGTVKTGESIYGYANVPSPLKASLASASQGLSVKTEGNNIIVTAEKSGVYSNVVVSVVDAEGVSYNSESFSFVADSINPSVKINSPLNMAWVQNKIELSGVASDDFGLAKIEWSSDGGNTWIALSGSSSFSQSIDVSKFEEGLIGIDVRATDRAGNEGYAHICTQKRVSSPEIQVLVPCTDDIINGMNLLVFRLKDAGSISKISYGADSSKASSNGIAISPYISVMVGTAEYPISNDMSFLFTDKSGNITTLKNWEFKVDLKGDLPVAEIHVPAEGATITDDFVVSGVVMDDDGDSHIFYKIDNGNFVQMEGWQNSFSIPLKIKDFTDNEHTITMYGTDIHGVKGAEIVRTFKVSLEEPKGAVTNPSFDKTVKDRVRVSGWASDKNGIQKVLVSLDNANTWNDAVGGTDWYYDFDTRIINDGTHTVFIKIFDNCGIQATYSSLINIDNTKPEIRLELPIDGSVISKNLFISGYTADNIKIKKLNLNIMSLDSKGSVPSNLSKINIQNEGIIMTSLDVSSLSSGFYNIELVGEDAAGNMTRASRNVEINKKSDISRVDILYPFSGSHISGEFNISGIAESEFAYEKLSFYMDGNLVSEAPLSATGYFKFDVPGTEQPKEMLKKEKIAKKTLLKKAKSDEDLEDDSVETSEKDETKIEKLSDGIHKIQIRGKLSDGSEVVSSEITVDYSYAGPWLKIDNFDLGDFAVQRPKISGSAGYNLSDEEIEIIKSKFKSISSDRKVDILGKVLDKVELSWDNGKSFETLGINKKWKFRVENEFLKDGFHYVIVKATFKNGEVASQRLLIQVDNQKPQIRLISPVPVGHYNGKLMFTGLSSDETNLKDVSITMRKGDKSRYEMPTIFQGMYYDGHVLGASAYDVGLGLSFFDNNVKLQVQYGQMTENMYDLLCKFYKMENGGMRYGGNIFGMKLLANIFDLNFKYYLGPDWEWLGMSLAVGADFSAFTETQAGKTQVLSALVAQFEFPRITIPNQKVFNTYSFYTEYQLWFIPSDIDDANIDVLINQLGFGLRIYMF